MFEVWQLVAIDEMGYNDFDGEEDDEECCISEDDLKKVARSIWKDPREAIDKEAFFDHCYKCGVNPNKFTQDDLDCLRDLLDELAEM